MEKKNLLKISEEARRIVKLQIIRLLDKGMSHSEIAELLNISRKAVDRVPSAYQAVTFPKVGKINMISSVSMCGKCHYLCNEEIMTQQLFINYMGKLVEYNGKKVFLIVDNLKVHRGKMVVEWLVEHSDQIRVFYTPAYSPEINPDEYLNHILKQNVRSGEIPHTQKSSR